MIMLIFACNNESVGSAPPTSGDLRHWNAHWILFISLPKHNDGDRGHRLFLLHLVTIIIIIISSKKEASITCVFWSLQPGDGTLITQTWQTNGTTSNLLSSFPSEIYRRSKWTDMKTKIISKKLLCNFCKENSTQALV